MVDEGISSEVAVVFMLVFNIDEMVGGELFEYQFVLDGFKA